ncbi:unnamed protein product [Notodromas monacha]|uniref:FAD synthase n=1 Tax=Notodromas monacha TaxID=399045 RepID=A0A7R9BPP7_9CRUS|nr:unnamed protein product [Notodromas monacha]CAG0919395.1 unnamed protein product [Notodromas monacha]
MRTYSSATFAVLSAGTALCRLVASRVEASRLRSLGHPCRFASAFFGGLGGMSLRGQSAYQLRPTAGIISSVKCTAYFRFQVSTIADDVDVIADEVRRFSETYTYVFTSGGIGPTHDDRTFESVAKAFDLRLVLHPDLEDFCRVWFKTSDITSVVFKMAKKLFHHPEFCTWNCELFLDMAEVDAAPVLNKAVSQFPKVTFGSYPVLGHSYYRTQITIEADVREDAEAAEKFLREGISKNQIVEYDRNPYEDRWEKLQKLLADPNKKELHEPIQKSLQVIDKCYNQFKPEEVCLFFNGGKDCTAVLHLVSCFLQHKYPNYRLTAVDVIEDDKAMFPQVHKFIEETEVRYNLELLTYRGSIRGALAQLLVEQEEREDVEDSIPENSKLNYGQVVQVSGKKSKFPLISVKNVYMFPGVPPLLRRAMDILAPKLFHHPEFCTWNCELFLDMAEVDAAPVLNKAVSQFPKVTFGSYPVLGHSYYRTQITIEADVREDAEAAEKFLREGISKNQIVEYDRNPYEDRWEKLQKLLADPNKKELHEPIQKSLQVIDKCYNQFKPEEVCLFFNGGKDCTAVLHLVSCFLQHKYPNYRLTAVDVIEDDKAMFPQVHKFIEETEVRYNLELLTYRGSIRGALAQLLVERPRVKAAFLGMRMGDPHAGESETATFAPTDPEWPPMMRVYPILHISYKELWDLIRSLYLPYCNLYDKGFTSLGRTDTTFPNPALQIFQPDSNKLGYLPAHRLADPKKERDGRIKTLPSAQESKKS